MTEGTKLHDDRNNKEETDVLVGYREAGAGLKATKFGEVSDLEKSFFPEKESVKPEAAVQPVVVAPKAVTANVLSEPLPVKNSTPVLKNEPASNAGAGTETLFRNEMAKMQVDYREGDVIKGRICSVEKAGVFVDIGYKSEGLITKAEFSSDENVLPENEVKVGEEISAYILKLESKEGYTLLSRKRAEYETAWNNLVKYQKSKEPLEVKVSSKVEGGLVASYFGIKGFMPASQVLKEADQSLDSFVNQTLPVAVLQVDRKRRKVIFSTKINKSKAKNDNTEKIFGTLESGQVLTGKVTSIKEFGVFVDIGGAEGLVHISELSWARVNHPSDVLAVGQSVNVFVLGVDKENRHISLGMKQLQPDPWVSVTQTYQVGQIVTGTITRIASFGAFIRLDTNIEGLIHISELSDKRVKKVEDVLSIGATIQAKIVKLIPEEQRIGLSLRELNQTPVVEPVMESGVAVEPETPAPVVDPTISF